MKPLLYTAIAAQQVATHPVKLMKLEATLNAGASATLFLQIHDSAVAPAAGAAPVKSWPAAECGYKEFELGEICLNAGLYIALSSTAGTFTASADTMDILNVELVDPETPTGTSTAGDLTSNVQSLQVWADAAGPKRLLKVEVDNTGNGAHYLMLFAKDSPADGDTPIDQFTIAASAVLTGKNALTFGENGRAVFSKSSAGADQDGCTLVMSDTAGTLKTSTDNFKLKAEYK